MTDTQNNQSQDDEVFAELYKAGAKETAPAKLNYEIINYAKNADKYSGSSHFAGDWKVPLSLAASVVVVFGLLVQLDQTPEQLELPPIPEISAPVESTKSKSDEIQTGTFKDFEKASPDEESTFSKDIKESDLDAQGSVQMEERTLHQKQEPKKQSAPQPNIIQSKPDGNRKSETKQGISSETLRLERSLEKSKSSDSTNTETLDSDDRPSSTAAGIQKQRSIESEKVQSDENIDTTSGIISGAEIQRKRDSAENSEQVFAPIPVEDWILMIEKLIARKDYAEAARQLQKFKQAHPKVNVEDLESKIP